MPEVLSPALAGLGLGIALAGAPGPVQAVLLAEALRAGPLAGLRAMLGATLTFGMLLVALALGVSLVVPSGVVLKLLKIVGGVFLIYLGVDGFIHHSVAPKTGAAGGSQRRLPPIARAALAVLLNPPAWLFLATAASSLVASATQAGGQPAALVAALALLLGVSAGDFTLVLAGGLGLRRAPAEIGRLVRRALALILALLGISLLLNGLLA